MTVSDRPGNDNEKYIEILRIHINSCIHVNSMYSSMTWRPSVRAQAESELRRPPVASASRAQGPRIGSAQGSSPDFFSTFSILFSPFSPRFPVLFVSSEGKVGKAELDLVIEVVARNSVLFVFPFDSFMVFYFCFRSSIQKLPVQVVQSCLKVKGEVRSSSCLVWFWSCWYILVYVGHVAFRLIFWW